MMGGGNNYPKTEPLMLLQRPVRSPEALRGGPDSPHQSVCHKSIFPPGQYNRSESFFTSQALSIELLQPLPLRPGEQ